MGIRRLEKPQDNNSTPRQDAIEAYMDYPERRFRRGIYALAKSLQAQGLTIPDDLQDYVNHIDGIKRQQPKS